MLSNQLIQEIGVCQSVWQNMNKDGDCGDDCDDGFDFVDDCSADEK